MERKICTIAHAAAKKDNFLFLSKNSAFNLPVPPQMNNHGNYIISLGNFTRWLAQQATDLGVEIYPGFAASEILYENDKVIGIATGDMGISKIGEKKDSYQPGIGIKANILFLQKGVEVH